MQENIIKKLLNDEVGILPTDTLYGLVGSALSEKAVKKIYKLKKREAKSPFIILVSSIEDLKLFGIKLNDGIKKLLAKYWPGKISIILPCKSKEFEYLHLGTESLAFRIPKKKNLIELLKKTGPLVAPSANHPGEKPALTIEQAEAYFKNNVDFYVAEGKLESLPSTIVKLDNNKIILVRKGAVRV